MPISRFFLLAAALLAVSPANAQTTEKTQAVASTLAADAFVDLCIRFGDSLPERASARRWQPVSALPSSEQLAVPNVQRYFGSRYADGWRLEQRALGSRSYTIYLFSDALATVPLGRVSSCLMVVDGVPPQGPIAALETFGAQFTEPEGERFWLAEKPYPDGWPVTRTISVAPGPPGTPLRAFLIAQAERSDERILPPAPPDLPGTPNLRDQLGSDE